MREQPEASYIDAFRRAGCGDLTRRDGGPPVGAPLRRNLREGLVRVVGGIVGPNRVGDPCLFA